MIRVTDETIDLRFYEFNTARTSQKSTVNRIARMLQVGNCHNMSEPLAIAVNLKDIDPGSLVDGYSESTHQPPLGIASFTTESPTLYVIAGVHRILAGQQASAFLRRRIEEFQKNIKHATQAHGDSEFDPRSHGPSDTITTQEDAVVAAEATIALAETWPVYFYDLGKS